MRRKEVVTKSIDRHPGGRGHSEVLPSTEYAARFATTSNTVSVAGPFQSPKGRRKHVREMLSRRWPRIALCGAVLVLGSSAIGAGSILARTNAPAMARMPMAQPAATRGTGTVVRLHQKVVRVSIHNFAFGPARLEVSRGTRLIWTNRDSDPHTVTSDKSVWASEALDTGNQFARVFKQAGTFPYHCSIHPFMHGTIIVMK